MVGAKQSRLAQLAIHLFFIGLSVVFIVPLWLIVAISLSDEADLVVHGYKLIPMTWDLTAYLYIFDSPMTIVNAYKVTMIISFVGTLLSVLMTSMCAYALSRADFKYKRFITFYLFFTMLFSGGLVPYYMLMTRYLHLQDTYAALIIPLLGPIFYIFLMRTFFQQLPESLVESAKIDGAGELRIYFTLIFPLSKPVFATVGLLQLLAYWNSWDSALLFINKHELYPLQYLLQVMIRNIQEILANMQNSMAITDLAQVGKLPTESMRMAMCVLAIGPMLFVFPFFQKYFAKGLTVGAVKG